VLSKIGEVDKEGVKRLLVQIQGVNLGQLGIKRINPLNAGNQNSNSVLLVA
jgi:hypothetical protein